MNLEHEIYLSEFGAILLYLIGGILFILVTLLVSKSLRPNRPNDEKLATYESGEEAIGSAWSQFNIRFYVVALIFILFEAELVFLFPWATVFGRKDLVEQTNGMWGWFSFIEMMIFVGMLVIALVYAWVHGHLDWIKPEQKVTQISSPVPPALYKKINDKYK